MDNNLREAGEDYLEAILILENEIGEARSIDVAKALGVSRPSVNKAMGILKEKGLIEQEPYGAIKLTQIGRKIAGEVYDRHRMLRSFLIEVLQVDRLTADVDACKMEHVISEETMTKLTQYVEKIKNN